MNPKNIVGNLICFGLSIHIWSGRRHLDKDDLVHANREFSKLPEKDLANLGSVKICDPEDIRQFHQLKTRAERLLRRSGLPIMGIWGVPVDRFDEVFSDLSVLMNEFNDKAAAFLQRYDERMNEWRMKHLVSHPEWERLFRDLPTAEHVGGRLAFSFDTMRIGAPTDNESKALEHFNNQVTGLKGELIRDVVGEARTFLDSLMQQSNTGVVLKREFITAKTLGPLKRAASKLEAFAFLDASIRPLADVLTRVLKRMPVVGRIESDMLLSLDSIASRLQTPNGVQSLLQLAACGQDELEESLEAQSTHTTDAITPTRIGALGDINVVERIQIELDPVEEDPQPTTIHSENDPVHARHDSASVEGMEDDLIELF